MWDLNVDNITVKGILASQIHEINPILLTEIVTSDILKTDITPAELITIGGIFRNSFY